MSDFSMIIGIGGVFAYLSSFKNNGKIEEWDECFFLS
jgi:hypothetical protein